MRIPGYEIDRRLVVGVKRTYYKGRRLSDNKPVIIKTATAIPPTQQDLTQAVHESDILKSIDIKGVTTPIAVEDFGKGSVLIYADKDYYSLKESIQTRKIALQDVLLISLNLTDIIGDLHLAGVIHKDIQPENIFIESPSNRVWISDFGIASFLPKENPMILNPDILGCSPIYISPEQSGRMNRSLDYRTDFYSLGITIYEMLTGRPPFQNIDPLELVHSHLAKQPLPPHQIDSDIPEVVSRIVLKLLAKTAEDRYQSVFGLKEDLETCRNRFLLDGSVPDFQIGVKDVSDIFRISQKLYGREKEINTLLELFERNNCGRVEMVMVSGYSGIGKTSLVREILKPITRKKGYFISGKSDQYHKNIPYSLLTSVFENLIRQLLTESEDQLKKWKARILDVLGDNGQLIIDVIPTIQLVIGPQLPVKSLNSEDAQIRFHAVLIDFIRVFRESEHPLIAFLDDLQWIDSATLNVLELVLADEELKHLFLIGAYRDNEVDDTHPLMISMKKFKSEGNNIHHIHLAPLEVDSIKVLIADTLKNESESIAPLAELVHRKTNGNPFFVNRFLTALYQQKLLVFNWSSSQWQWDISHIQSQDITDNVIDLLIKRLKDISAETVDLLRFAACIGNQFELKMLSLLCGKEPAETLSILIPAIKEDLVESVSGFRMISEIAIDDSMQVEALKFQHDRIYKACYDLTDEFEKKSIHLQIGKVLLENLDGKKKEEAVFDILNHLNQSFELIETDIEREELARLNLLAGRKAKSSAAFESAMEYIETAYHLLRPNYWEEQYQLALEVHTEYLDITHNCGRFEEMELWFGLIKQNALTPLDKVSAYNSCIVACMAQNRIKDANQTSLEILSALGESVDEKLTEDEVLQKVEKIMRGLGSQDIEGLADLSEMTDPSKLAALTILSSMNSVIYIGYPDIFPVIVCKQIELLIDYGNAPDSPFSYAAFGALLCGMNIDLEAGYRFGQLALSILSRMESRESKARVNHVVGGYVIHWKVHVEEALELALSGYQSGIETGDFEFAGYNVYSHGLISFLVGKRLDTTAQEMETFGNSIRRLKQETALRFNMIFHQTVLNLIGEIENPSLLGGPVYDERLMLPLHEQASDRLAILFYSFCKLVICFLFGDYVSAEEYADKFKVETSVNPGGPLPVAVFRFYDSLIRLALYSEKSLDEQESVLKIVRENQEKLKNWADHAPMNYLHKYYLVEAELAAKLGNSHEAYEQYDLAIELAKRYRYVNEEALANELAASFRFKNEDSRSALVYMEKAYHCYTLWGASRKIKQLESDFPGLLQDDTVGSDREIPPAIVIDGRRSDRGSEGFDLLTLLKTTQAISSEIELDKLLTTLMKIVIENAGAESGLLVLQKDDRLTLAAKGSTIGTKVVLTPPVPLDNRSDLPTAIVNYVARTRESIVLDNAVVEGQFIDDTYVQTYAPQSVLCVPIYYKAKMSGVLYLENRLAASVFSTDRMEVLKVLMSQIAISIENSRLYEDRKEAEEKYRGIFENAVEGIFQSTVEGRFISVNPSAARILGYDSSDELVQKVISIEKQLYVLPSERQELIRSLHSSKWVEGDEVQFYKKDGSRIWVALNVRPVFDADGKLKIIEGFFSDVTERKKETEALRVSEEILRKENTLLKSNFKDRYKFGAIIGKSQPMQEVYELILKAASINANVIIYGESGTGKELVAKAIHDTSDRKNGKFIPVNCGAIPENLLESEFFGYKKGAFTGANTDKEGYLDLADQGTLFLDELGEIDLSLQVKLLRALEGGGYTPVGGQILKRPDVRVVAATNRDLQQLVREGKMREDFFYRVHIIPIHLPALRERKEDIPLLIEHFMRQYSNDQKISPISGQMLEGILNHNWPGNVRELQNVIHRFVSLNIVDFVQLSTPRTQPLVDVPMDMEIHADVSYQEVMDKFEKKLLEESLKRNKWQRESTASYLGIPARTFYRKLKKHGLVRQ